MDFLRESRPDHWGIKKDEEKRKMEEKAIIYKTCEQCGEKKRVDQCFDERPTSIDGYEKKCIKCKLDNKKGSKNMAKTDNEEMVVETAKVHLRIMELDFKGREELYQNICQAAKEELRTPENQLMWWIMNTDPEKMRKGLAGE